MKRLMTNRVKFICRSLLWSLLIYTVVFAGMNWKEISQKVAGEAAQPQGYVTTSPVFSSVNISMEGVRKEISLASKVLRYIGIWGD